MAKTKCLLSKVVAGTELDATALGDCETAVNFDGDVGVLDEKEAEFAELTSSEKFTCNEATITFGGETWEVPQGDAPASSEYVSKPFTPEVSLAEESSPFALCSGAIMMIKPPARARQETRASCEVSQHHTHRECHMMNKGICYGRVKYGYGDTWTEWRDVAGEFHCSNEVFGDPYKGQGKECICDEVIPKCALDQPVFIVGHRDQVLADHKGNVIMHSNRLDWETWTLSAAEDGVLITSHQNLQLQDNSNHLRMHQNKASWETWVLSPGGEGRVMIASHRDRYLGDHKGTVLLTANKHLWERWTITTTDGELACH